jgi:DNA-binding transcriptional LysR family regulator
MRYHFDHIAAFLHAVEAGSISGAAERLNLAKSAVSKRISALEASIGVELVHRSARGIVPTDRGRSFYSHARSLLRELDNVVEEMSEGGELCGRMRITLPMSCAGAFRIGRLVCSFASRHPRLELTLDYDDRLVDVEREGYDLAIRMTRLHDTTLIARKLAMLAVVLCCSPSYAKEFGAPHGIEDLAKHACLSTSRSRHVWEFEPGGGGPRSVHVRSRIVTNNADALRDAAVAGLGIAMLPQFFAQQALEAGELVRVLPQLRPPPEVLCALYPRLRHPSRKTGALVEFLTDAFRRRYWEEHRAPAEEQWRQPAARPAQLRR